MFDETTQVKTSDLHRIAQDNPIINVRQDDPNFLHCWICKFCGSYSDGYDNDETDIYEEREDIPDEFHFSSCFWILHLKDFSA